MYESQLFSDSVSESSFNSMPSLTGSSFTDGESENSELMFIPFPNENAWARRIEYTPQQINKLTQFVKKKIVRELFECFKDIRHNKPFVKGGFPRDFLASEFYTFGKYTQVGETLDQQAYYARGDIDIQFFSIQKVYKFVKYLLKSFNVDKLNKVSYEKYHDHAVYRTVVSTKYYPQAPVIKVDVDFIIPLYDTGDNYIIDVNTLMQTDHNSYTTTMNPTMYPAIMNAIEERTATIYLKSYKSFTEHDKYIVRGIFKGHYYRRLLLDKHYYVTMDRYYRYLLSAMKKVVKMMERGWKFTNAPFTLENGMLICKDDNMSYCRDVKSFCDNIYLVDGDIPHTYNSITGQYTSLYGINRDIVWWAPKLIHM